MACQNLKLRNSFGRNDRESGQGKRGEACPRGYNVFIALHRYLVLPPRNGSLSAYGDRLTIFVLLFYCGPTAGDA